MADFIAFDFAPVLAIWWIGVGCLGLVFTIVMFATVALGKPVRNERTGELCSRSDSAKTIAMLGSAFLFAAAVGITILKLTERKTDDPQSILLIMGALCALGGILAAIFLWRGLSTRPKE